MTIRRATTEPGRARRAVAAVLVLAVLLLVTWYATAASLRVRRVQALRTEALLGLPPSAAAALRSLPEATVQGAMAAMPLDQRIANVAMACAVRREGDARAPAWLDVVARLGWRDTAALQNMLYAAARAQDLPRILDIGDALLRRQQFTDQIIPAISTVELDPTLRSTLVRRLVAGPNWRGMYLASTGHLQRRDQLVARFALIREMQRRGARFGEGEVLATIRALDAGGLPQYGFALWQAIRPGATRPLDDTGFALASRGWGDDDATAPYQWRMMAGEGFSADASRDGALTPLVIDWNGRGVPLFAQQRTSATPGSYALEVVTPAGSVAGLSALAFRMACGDAATPFRPAGKPGRYVTAAPVPCAFPVLQIAGDVQPSAAGHQVTIERISLRRLGSATAR